MAGKQKKGRPPSPVGDTAQVKGPMISLKLKAKRKTSRGK
jgi:hypothetical protein